MKPTLVLAFSVAISASVLAQRFQYEKFEYNIPMRDGVNLYTAVYVPKGMPGKHPILMERTPYGAGPYGPTAMRGARGSVKLKEAGFIFAYQDVRGKGASEGDFSNVRPQLKAGQKGVDESTDTWDTVEYLVKNVPGNNGSVGLWGISYPGFYAGAGGINSHPALKAISPQAPVSDWFIGDDMHHGGCFFLEDSFNFFRGFGNPRKGVQIPGDPLPPLEGRGDSYAFFLGMGGLSNSFDKFAMSRIPFWVEMSQHPNFDSYWQDRSLPRQMKGVKCAVLIVGGLFDAEDLWGALNLYAATERQNKSSMVYLVMGPWYHGMWAGPGGKSFGDLDWGSMTSQFFQDEVEAPFFLKFLNGDQVAPPAEATMFDTGSHSWTRFPVWPPKGTKSQALYFGPNKTLTDTKPKSDGADTYIADPMKPTPYTDPVPARRNREYMLSNQAFASARRDVLTYQTEPLNEDLTLAGPVIADLVVSTTGTDADFIVKVVDAYPADAPDKSSSGKSLADYQMLVRWESLRGRFRDSFSNPKPFSPLAPTPVKVKLNDVFHTFRKGHRIVVQVQSYMFPLIDRNANQFVDLYHAKDSDFQSATISVFRSPARASSLRIQVLPK